MHVRRVTVVMLFGMVGACTGDGVAAPPLGLSHATATPFCAPDDGPAVAIYIGDTEVSSIPPSGPHLQVAIWSPIASLSGRAWSVAPDDGAGAAWLYRDRANFEFAAGGAVTVRSVTTDKTVIGTLDVVFPGPRRIKGGFTAKWIPGNPLCG